MLDLLVNRKVFKLWLSTFRCRSPYFLFGNCTVEQQNMKGISHEIIRSIFNIIPFRSTSTYIAAQSRCDILNR